MIELLAFTGQGIVYVNAKNSRAINVVCRPKRRGWLSERGRSRCGRVRSVVDVDINKQLKFGLRAHASLDAENGRADKLSLDEVALVKRVTEKWVSDFVVSLNLCPFAEPVLSARTHRVVVSDAKDETGVQQEVWNEIEYLLSVPAERVETILVVMPLFAADDFLRFHELCRELEERVEDDDALVDEVMLACFHPGHEWGVEGDGEGEGDDDAINFDKRAPYAIINLLRAPHVDQYVEEGRTQGILERNSRTLRRIGGVGVRKMFAVLWA